MADRVNQQVVCVTGSAGFIGRALVPLLHESEKKIIAYDRVEMTDLPVGAFACVGEFDSCVDAIMEAFVSHKGSRVIVHLAGESGAGFCAEYPDKAFDSNVRLTADVLQLARLVKANTVVLASTGYVYGDSSPNAFNETDVPVPQSVYAASKLAAESLVIGASYQYKFTGIIARLANVIGPGAHSSTVLMNLIKKASIREALSVSDSSIVRDFIHRDDVVAAFTGLVEARLDAGPHIFNVSTGIGTSLGELTDIVARVSSVKKSQNQEPQKSEVGLVLSNDRLKKAIGWSPSISIEETVYSLLSERQTA